MDEYAAMLTYTQSVKENAGVQDSFTTEKTDQDKMDELEAKKVVEKYDNDHPEPEQQKSVIEESIEEEKPEKDKKIEKEPSLV